MFNFTDPYEEARQPEEEAKLLRPEPAKKNRKFVTAALVFVGLALSMVILANVAGMVTNHAAAENPSAPKPKTMTAQDSQSFAEQQAGQAAFLQRTEADKKRQAVENTVLGEANDLAGDAYQEVDGVPSKTKAQDDAERGRSPNPDAKTEAEQQRDKAELEALRRQQSDLDSSPVSVDFADYFEKQKAPAVTAPSPANPDNTEGEAKPDSAMRERRHVANVLSERTDATVTEPATTKHSEPHDPKDDYVFDRSSGKLYRLLEDTILETVLVNRLNGSSAGPVICMVTTDVYSQSGTHLLIPKGTRLLGSVHGVASANQERLFVAFHRMILPDGYSVSLDKFQGLDVVGQSGLRDLVNHHYVQIFGTSIALAAIAAVAQVGNSSSSYGAYDWGVSLRNGVSQGLGQSAQRVMERFLNVLPTFTIRERARVKVLLSGDLLLPDSQNHNMDPDL